MKTSELIGPTLNWAIGVALQEKVYFRKEFMKLRHSYLESNSDLAWHLSVQTDDLILGCLETGETRALPDYSGNWAQGGPIIERERISLTHERPDGSGWTAETDAGHDDQSEHGPTPLIAAMRCYVASKLGDEVDIPSDLMTGDSK